MRQLTTVCLLSTAMIGGLMFGAVAGAAPTIWNGPDVTFTKQAFADPTDPANQDVLTPNVALTRGSVEGIYNAAVEASYQNLGGGAGPSPVGTLWALGTTADIGSLTFDNWFNTVGTSSSVQGPINSVGVDMVLHLVTDDIYIDLKFLEWGQGSGSGGTFSYTRSSAPVPEPTGLALAAVAGLAVFGFRRRSLNCELNRKSK